MARTTQEIFDSMVAEGKRLALEQSNASMTAMFNNTSRVAIWRLLFFVKAFAINVHEKLFDTHITTVDGKLDSLIPPTLSWHRTKLKAFQFGFNLIPETDQFDNTGHTIDEIANSKIISYAAVTEATVDNARYVLYKVAKLVGTDLVPLTNTELAALHVYIKSYKPAGVNILVYNQVADLLRCEIDVYYNALLIDGNGLRTSGAGYPVQEAAILYPTTLEFDGEFINSNFIDALQSCYGVSRRKVNLKSMERKTDGSIWQSVGSSFIPEAGYCKFNIGGLTINYIADNV
jgi:hypothetical protein